MVRSGPTSLKEDSMRLSLSLQVPKKNLKGELQQCPAQGALQSYRFYKNEKQKNITTVLMSTNICKVF